MSWTDKYSPKTVGDILGNSTPIKEIYKWMQMYNPHIKPKAYFITGTPGIGKTLSIHLMAEECGYMLTEINASDDRTLNAVLMKTGIVYNKSKKKKKKGNNVLISKTIGMLKKRIFVFDEMDGSSVSESLINLLANICVNSQTPLAIISNSDEYTTFKRVYYSSSYKRLKGMMKVIRFNPPHPSLVVRRVHTICSKEGVITPTHSQVQRLYVACNNDVRSLLNNIAIVTKNNLKSIDEFIKEVSRNSDYVNDFSFFRQVMIAGNSFGGNTAHLLNEERVDKMSGFLFTNYLNFGNLKEDLCSQIAESMSYGDQIRSVYKKRESFFSFRYMRDALLHIPSSIVKENRCGLPSRTSPPNIFGGKHRDARSNKQFMKEMKVDDVNELEMNLQKLNNMKNIGKHNQFLLKFKTYTRLKAAVSLVNNKERKNMRPNKPSFSLIQDPILRQYFGEKAKEGTFVRKKGSKRRRNNNKRKKLVKKDDVKERSMKRKFKEIDLESIEELSKGREKKRRKIDPEKAKGAEVKQKRRKKKKKKKNKKPMQKNTLLNYFRKK